MNSVPPAVLDEAAGYLAGLAHTGAMNTAAALDILTESQPAQVARIWLDGHHAVSAIADLSHNLGVDRLSIFETVSLIQPAGHDLAVAASLVEHDVQVRLRPELEAAATALNVNRSDPDAFTLIDDGAYCAKAALELVRRIRERFRANFAVLVRRDRWPDFLLQSASAALRIRADFDAERILELANVQAELLPFLASLLWSGKTFESLTAAIGAARKDRRTELKKPSFKLGRKNVAGLGELADLVAAPLDTEALLIEQVDGAFSEFTARLISTFDETERTVYEGVIDGLTLSAACREAGLDRRSYERIRKKFARIRPKCPETANLKPT